MSHTIKKILITTQILMACIGGMAYIPSIVSAEPVSLPSEYTLLEPLPCVPGNGVNCAVGTQLETASFAEYVQYIFNLIIAIAAVAAVFMIVWGGFKYTSTDSYSGKSEGKEIIIKAVEGLLMVLVSYLFLKTIDPRLVAIPKTLVTPLEYKIDRSTTAAGLFEQLAKEASLNKQVNQEALTAARDLSTKYDSLADEISDVQEELALAREEEGNFEKVSELELKEANLLDQQKKAVVGIKILAAQSDFRTVVNPTQPSQGTAGTDFNKASEAVNEIYSRRESELRAAGADAAQLSDLKDYKIYSQTMIRVNEQAAKVFQDKIDLNNTVLPTRGVDRIQFEKIKTESLDQIQTIAANTLDSSPVLGIANRELQKKLLSEVSEIKATLKSLTI